MMTLPQLFKAMLEHKASDMHLTSGSPPAFRVHGQMVRVKAPSLTPAETKELCYSVLTDYQKALFEENRELDFSFGIRDLARFRANMYHQRGTVAGAFRYIPFEIPALSTLGVPAVLEQLLQKPKGLILVTGATGCGKTTTLASLIDTMNDTEHLHIVTIEDPIEYIHAHRNCVINQREVGQDTKTFGSALRAALREDPDVVLVGEMRDRETIETALTLAETGHLVLSSLHTNSAYQTISRIVQGFPAHDQDQIRLQLSMVLEAIITQALLERSDKRGRVLAYELLIPNAGIRNLIRENKLHQIGSAMQLGQEYTNMVTFNQCLLQLIQKGLISPEVALEATNEPDDLIRNLTSFRRQAS